MKKVACPKIEPGENMHQHSCDCCDGWQHIPAITALKHKLADLLVLIDCGNFDATDKEMHSRIDTAIAGFAGEQQIRQKISFAKLCCEEPLATLRACINTITFSNK